MATVTATPQDKELQKNAGVNGHSLGGEGGSKEGRRPTRSFMDDPMIKWRHGGPPDFSRVDADFLDGRTHHHAAGSLEEIVENLVKTWEMEQSHKVDHEQWGTVDCASYRVTVNGVKSYDLEEAKRLGTYNMLLMDSPFYDSENQTFESSHKLFKQAFAGSFPWEVLEVFSGPPIVAFTWRHWGRWTGKYGDVAPSGELVELRGFCKATVTDDLRIESLEIFYDPNPFLLTFLNGSSSPACPMNGIKRTV